MLIMFLAGSLTECLSFPSNLDGKEGQKRVHSAVKLYAF